MGARHLITHRRYGVHFYKKENTHTQKNGCLKIIIIVLKFGSVLRERVQSDIRLLIDCLLSHLHVLVTLLLILSYIVAVILWIRSCHKNDMTTCCLDGEYNVMSVTDIMIFSVGLIANL